MSTEQHDENALQASSPSPTDPTVKMPRNLPLDVMRGFAVLAAFAVAVWAAGGFTQNMQTKLLTHPSGGNYRLFAAVSLLLEGKMQALIALIFGAGLVMFLSRRQAGNKDTAHDLYVRRHLWLIGFGLINAFVFLWTNDLLFHLGVLGILTLPFIQATPRGLIIAAVVAMAIFTGKQYWNYADDKKALRKYEAVVAVEKKIKQDSTDRARKDSVLKAAGQLAKDTAKAKANKDTLTQKQKSEKEAWEGKLKGMKYDSKKDEGERKAMRNTSYGKVWNYLLPKSQAREAQYTYTIGVWELGMMILLGMALLKLGFFDKRFSGTQYLLAGLTCIGIGLLLGWYRLYFQNATLLDYTKYIKSHRLPYGILIPLERSIMAVGYAALMMGLVNARRMGWLWQSIGAVGHMSLTNYLLQCLAGTLFFTGVGMNYYGTLSQWQLYVVVAELWLVQIVFSVAWLRYFTMGPAEWLWHSLVEKKRMPWRRQD